MCVSDECEVWTRTLDYWQRSLRFFRNNLHSPEEEHDIFGSVVTLYLLRNNPDVPAHLGSLQTATVSS